MDGAASRADDLMMTVEVVYVDMEIELTYSVESCPCDWDMAYCVNDPDGRPCENAGTIYIGGDRTHGEGVVCERHADMEEDYQNGAREAENDPPYWYLNG